MSVLGSKRNPLTELDEPFGLVAVEFGRKGALGVGSRVGGLGNMPGWWYTIESTTSKHLISQFKMAIKAALACKSDVRASMRARSARQRFPVAQWKETLNMMQDTAISLSNKQSSQYRRKAGRFSSGSPAESEAPTPPGFWGRFSISTRTASPSPGQSGGNTRTQSPSRPETGPLSLGVRTGPGHEASREGRRRKRLSKPMPNSRDSSRSSWFRGRSGSSSRTVSPARRHKRDSKTAKRSTLSSEISEPAPTLPPLHGQLAASRVSRITEDTNEDASNPNASQRDLRQLDFEAGATAASSIYEDSDHEIDVDHTTVDEYILTPEQVAASRESRRQANIRWAVDSHAQSSSVDDRALPPFAPAVSLPESLPRSRTPSLPGTPDAEENLISSHPRGSASSTPEPVPPEKAYLSLGNVLQGKKDYNLQHVEPFFNDPTGLYYNTFDKKLQKLNGKNSEGALCIEDYLTSSEKNWFSRFRNVKMGKSAAATPSSSIFGTSKYNPLARRGSDTTTSENGSENNDDSAEQFLLKEGYQPPTGIKKLLLRRIGQWPLYTFLLAFVGIPKTHAGCC